MRTPTAITATTVTTTIKEEKTELGINGTITWEEGTPTTTIDGTTIEIFEIDQRRFHRRLTYTTAQHLLLIGRPSQLQWGEEAEDEVGVLVLKEGEDDTMVVGLRGGEVSRLMVVVMGGEVVGDRHLMEVADGVDLTVAVDEVVLTGVGEDVQAVEANYTMVQRCSLRKVP